MIIVVTTQTTTRKDVFLIRIPQIPGEIKTSFKELKFAQFLREANMTKAKDFSALFVFITIFMLTFQKETWFEQTAMSKKADSIPGKDAIYRFLSKSTFNWRKFLLLSSSHAIQKCDKLTEELRVKVLIVDDSLFERARSKKVELLSKVFDHTTMKFVKGYQLLILGWSDGATFIPVNFSLTGYAKHLIEGMSTEVDKRTSGYKRRQECLMTKPKVTASLIKQAIHAGISADYVLMDTWFTEEPLIQDILGLGLDVIGMVKRTSKRQYKFKGKTYTLHQLISYCNQNKNTNAILGSLIVKMKEDTSVKIVFVQHRSNKNKWLAILSTDTSLSDEEIIRIYGYRWEIEVFFKCNKSHLNLNKEFQCRTYDAMIAHTTIVFSRYIFLAWEHRKNNDTKTLGHLFFEFGEDVREVDFKEALLGLMKLILDLIQTGEKEIIINVEELKNRLLAWMSSLPKYLQNLLIFESESL